MSACFFIVALALLDAGSSPCVSGLQAGLRPGPYSSVVATGPQRGQQHCFICETADNPAVIVFARQTTDPAGRLLVQVDQALATHQKEGLRSWATFLSDNQLELDPKLVEWSRKLGLRSLPLSVFEDRRGPPSYRLSDDAEVTVLLSAKQKVVANFAFRPGELTDAKIKDIIAALPRILKLEGTKQ